MDDARDVSLGWTDGSVPLHTHACFYYSDEESLRRALSFIRVGLDAPRELNVIFADQSRHASLLDWLRESHGSDVDARLASGKLVMVGGAPTRAELLAGIAGALDRGLAQGHDLVRFLGFIAWGEDGWPDEDELLQFESEVNSAVLAYPAVIICTYGVPRLSGRPLVEGALTTHPVIFLNDRVLTGNPLYVDPSLRTAADGG